MNELQLFNNPELGAVCIIAINGETFFVGKDIGAQILGYTNTLKAVRNHVGEEDKLTERIVLAGQNSEVVCINESCLYSNHGFG